jgi:hypothetical protein
MDQVEELRVHVGRLIAAPVPQELIDPGDLFLVVAAIALEGESPALFRMAEIQLQRLVALTGFGGPGRTRGDGRQKKTNREADAQADRSGNVAMSQTLSPSIGGSLRPRFFGRIVAQLD